MSAPDTNLAYFTIDRGEKLATIDPKLPGGLAILGEFRDINGSATGLKNVFGIAYGKDGELYATQQKGGQNSGIDVTGNTTIADTQIWKVILPPAKDGSNSIVNLEKIGTGLGTYEEGGTTYAVDAHAMDIGPDGSMWVLDYRRNLFKADLTTGKAEFVRATDLPNSPAPYGWSPMDIVFDNAGDLYAVGNKELYKINIETGKSTLIGSGLGAEIMGIWSDAEGNLFGTAFTKPGNHYEIDKTTGVATKLSNWIWGDEPHGGDFWIPYPGWGDEASISISTSAGIQKPDASFVATADSVTEAVLTELKNKGIILNSQAIDFKVETGGKSPVVTANLALSSISEDLVLTGADGKRDPAKKLGYVSIKDNGDLDSLSWDPLVNAGARFFDTDGDGIADFLSLTLVDGGTGDKDGIEDGVIVDPSTAATVKLDPVITALESGFFKIGDPNSSTDLAGAALALKATLTKRSDTANQIGYVILNDGEADTTVGELSAFKERARILFTNLEADDVTLNDALKNLFNQQFLLRNNQSIRFFAIADATLDQLTSLSDSRFSFLKGSLDATTGSASFSSATGISFDLELLNNDQNLSALIAQEQHKAPLLDFTAFTNGETITGTIVQAREADYDAVTGFYRVLDTSGSVRAADGSLLTPGDAGYADAALLNANRISALGDLSIADGDSSSSKFSLQDASYIAPFAQVNGNTFFAFADANPDRLSHFRSLGSNLFGLEDQLGGGDLDFDDHVFGFSISGLTPATPA